VSCPSAPPPPASPTLPRPPLFPIPHSSDVVYTPNAPARKHVRRVHARTRTRCVCQCGHGCLNDPLPFACFYLSLRAPGRSLRRPVTCHDAGTVRRSRRRPRWKKLRTCTTAGGGTRHGKIRRKTSPGCLQAARQVLCPTPSPQFLSPLPARKETKDWPCREEAV
jgi:hypothetical protein